MAYSFVQEAHNFSFTTGKPSLTLSVTKGNLLLVWMSAASATLLTIDDGGQNSWVPISSGSATLENNGSTGGSLVGGYGSVALWYAIARETRSITVKYYDTTARNTGTGAGGNQSNLTTPAVQFLEFTGNSSNPFDATATATGNSTAPAAGVTVSGAADLVIGIPISSTSGTDVETGGWTNSVAASTSFASVYAIETSSGTFTPTFLLSPSGTWGVIAAGFKSVGPGHTISGSLGVQGAGAQVLISSNTTGIFSPVTADGSGNYTSASLEDDAYTVRPQLPGQVFSPATSIVTLNGANSSANNFTPTAVNTNLSFVTLASDSFIRANENPLNPAVWAQDGTPVPPWDSTLKLVNNEVGLISTSIVNNLGGPTFADGISTYIAKMLPRDQWIEFQLDSLDSTGWAQFQINQQSPLNDTAGHSIQFVKNIDGTLRVIVFENLPAFTTMWFHPTLSFAPGDRFRIASIGVNYYLYQNGSLIGTCLATKALSGNPGMEIAGLSLTSAQVSHFLAGSVQLSNAISPWNLIQEGHSTFNFATSTQAVFVEPVTQGNLLIAWAETNAASIPAPTDTLGNTWTQIGTTLVAGYGRIAAYYAIANSTGNTTVTFAGLVVSVVQCMEFSGNVLSGVLDASATGTSTTTSLSATVTTTKAQDLIVGFAIPAAGGSGVVSAGLGWVNAASPQTQAFSAIFKTASGLGPVSPTFVASPNGSQSGVIAAAFFGNPLAYSEPDCRVIPYGPNSFRALNGTNLYDVVLADSRISGDIPVDSRISGDIPVDSRIGSSVPTNSRTPGTFGPGQ